MLANTLGIKFLRRAIEEGDPRPIRRVQRDLFLVAEQPAFDAVSSHIGHYGSVPSFATLAQLGVSFPPAQGHEEPPAYYAAEMRRRAAYNAVNSRHPALSEALKSKDMTGVVGLLREMLAEAASRIEEDNFSSLTLEAQRVLDDYAIAKMSAGLRGVSLRWPTLNAATQGAQGGDLVVVCGRPGVGKSWIMLEMAMEAQRTGRVSAFASMEMSLMQIARRWVGGMTGINPNDIRGGTVSHWSEAELLAQVELLSQKAPVHLFKGDMNKSVDGLAQMMDEFDPDIMYVDAAYLLSPSARSKSGISRWETISAVVRELKQLAMHKNRPIVISVQFNRNQRSRPKKDDSAPDLADIAGTDSIPQDASIVIGAVPGRPPFQLTRLLAYLMKNRDGEEAIFGINKQFNPVNFDEVPVIDEAAAAGPVVDTSWML